MTWEQWVRFLAVRLAAIAVVAAVVTFFQAVTAFFGSSGAARFLPLAQRGPVFWAGAYTEERDLFTLQFHIPPAELSQGVEVSLMLAIGSVLVAAVVALPLGIYAAAHRKQWFAHIGPTGSLVLQGIPTFVAALWLQMYVAETWHLLPVLGWTSPASAVLPMLALAAGNVAYLTKFMQAGMTDALRQDYVIGAKARGLSQGRIIMRHALKPALLSTITFFGTQTAYLINNTLVISALFQIPGISSALGESMVGGGGGGAAFPGLVTPFGTTGNVPVVFFLFAVITMLFNLTVDVSYRFLDPRATLTI